MPDHPTPCETCKYFEDQGGAWTGRVCIWMKGRTVPFWMEGNDMEEVTVGHYPGPCKTWEAKQ